MAQEPLCSQDSYLLLQEGNYLVLQTLLCLYMYIHISVFVTGSTHYVKNPRKLYIYTISERFSTDCSATINMHYNVHEFHAMKILKAKITNYDEKITKNYNE